MGFIKKWMDDALGNEYSYCDSKEEIAASHYKGLEALNLSNISTVLGVWLVGLVFAGLALMGEIVKRKKERAKSRKLRKR